MKTRGAKNMLPRLLQRRSTGILLHITSLPGGPFSGDLGPSAHAFADFLAEAGQSWWQTLPLNPVGPGNSPYSSISSFACEPLLISPEALLEDGLLERRLLRELPKSSSRWRVSFPKSRKLRTRLLGDAYRRFLHKRPAPIVQSMEVFKAREKKWLDTYCFYQALAGHFDTYDWTAWPKDIAKAEHAALRSARRSLEPQVEYLIFEQCLFDRQWRALKSHCRDRGVRMIGDLPMYVSPSSADVWAHQEAFMLYANGRPRFVAGTPPDLFSKTGQLWGNALYDWSYHERTAFAWWKDRLRRQLDLFDVVRLDHFIGFSRYWRVPGRARTAKGGRWMPAPGRKLFDALARTQEELPFIAEDLGEIDQAVRDLRDRYGLPGMKILQFGFGSGEGARVHRPHAYPQTCVAYTGTHDNDTIVGWYRSLKRRARSGDAGAQAELRRAHAYLGTTKRSEVAEAAIRTLCTSRANTVIFPLQDVLSLDGTHRMNVPATADGNWQWRLKDGELDPRVANCLRTLAAATDRQDPVTV